MAAVQSAARALLAGLGGERDVMSGLARRVLASGPIEPVTLQAPVPSEVEATTLRRSPVLAALGYEIGEHDPAVQSLWLDGMERLRGREAFLGNGQSFVHNPGEVLGVMSGLEALADDDHGHREWFQLLMQRGLNEGKFRTPITRLAACICLSILDPNQSGRKVTEDELRLLMQSSDLLQAAAMIIAFCPAWLKELHEMVLSVQCEPVCSIMRRRPARTREARATGEGRRCVGF